MEIYAFLFVLDCSDFYTSQAPPHTHTQVLSYQRLLLVYNDTNNIETSIIIVAMNTTNFDPRLAILNLELYLAQAFFLHGNVFDFLNYFLKETSSFGTPGHVFSPKSHPAESTGG